MSDIYTDSFYRHIAQTSDSPMALEIDYAEGPFIFTKDGKRYLDLISGIAVSSLGHRHPAVVRAVKEQVDRHMHVMVYGEYIQKPQSQLAELLTSLLPEKLDRVYFVNSGTEANEGALKLAKKHTGRHKLVSFHNSYHGDSHGSLSVTGREVYRKPFQPLLPDVHFLNYNSTEGLDAIDDQTAAVILEPIQGEGGVIPADKEWLKKVRQACDDAGAVLIFDEVQTGFGRTGYLFAFEYYDVVPDIMTLAKAMGGGMPIGGIVSSSGIFEGFKHDPPLNHVTTFGGHPVSCAAAYAALRALISEGWIGRAGMIEEKARAILQGPGIVEVRGRGAMLGLELENRELTRKVVEECLQKGIILGWTLHSNTLIRIAPPLIIGEKVLEEALETIVEVIRVHNRMSS
ncbi:MAG TPA: aminotransferase class III-fold pyridoxal phosphate-dependent enzyme [Balneolales bacterium]|nr:aminotransferase class III-fold pyridoxal phosphate-dependent enzyme [Balneolales bacterium]